MEVDHVFRVYDNISVHWNHTRGKRKVHWPRIKIFIESLPKGSLIADIGSGDGKYFGLNPDIFSIGCDRSLRLLEVSRSPAFETFCCDAVKLPFVSDKFDASLCIAVMHHLASRERRVAVVSELVRITSPGGFVMIHAWAQEQGEDSRHEFPEQDMLVPWRLQKRFFQPGQQGSGNDASQPLLTVAKTKKLQKLQPTDANKQEKNRRRKKRIKDVLLSSPEISQSSSAHVEEGALDCVRVDTVVNETNDGNESDDDDGNDHDDENPVPEAQGLTVSENSDDAETSALPSSDAAVLAVSPDGPCEHVVEDDAKGQLIFQRYCHVYKQGELEQLCEAVSGCRIIETGWDKGNWTVLLLKDESVVQYLNN